jgi:hypothetical protein
MGLQLTVWLIWDMHRLYTQLLTVASGSKLSVQDRKATFSFSG